MAGKGQINQHSLFKGPHHNLTCLAEFLLLFLQKRFLYIKLQYLVSTYLQLDCLYLKKQIYSETFCYPTPM